MKNKRLEARRKKISKEVDLFVKHSFDFVDRIHQILEKQGKGQKELAKALGKSESEVSKWMAGTHNFTFKTAAKIEAVLGEPILQIKEEKQVNQSVSIYISSPAYQMRPKKKSSHVPKRMEVSIGSSVAQTGKYLS